MSLRDPTQLADGTQRSGNSDYDALPRGVKDLHPYDSWLWMPDDQKARLVQTECEPEPEED